jgi:WD40 repeat protein
MPSMKLEYSIDGSRLAAGASNVPLLEIWDVKAGSKLVSRNDVNIWDMAFCDGDFSLVTLDVETDGESIVVRDVSTLAEKQRHRRSGRESINWLAVDSGRELVAAFTDHRTSIAVMELPTLHLRNTFKLHANWSPCLGFSPDGTLLATGSSDRFARLYDPATGVLKLRLVSSTGVIKCLAFSTDGRTIATGGDDAIVKLWRVSTGQELMTFDGLNGKIGGIQFSNDGRKLACWTNLKDWDLEVHVWSLTHRTPNIPH